MTHKIALFENYYDSKFYIKLANFINNLPWQYNLSGNDKTNHWKYNFLNNEKQIKEEFISNIISDLLNNHLINQEIVDCYAIAFTLGTEGKIKMDNFSPNFTTTIIYTTLFWDPNFAGELIFLSESGEPFFVTLPTPNKLISFSSDILFVDRAISQECDILKTAIVLKTRVKK